MVDPQTDEDKILSILTSIVTTQQKQAESQESLAATVASLAEQVAHLADQPSDATVASEPADLSHIVFKHAPDHLPLVEADEENTARRVNIAVMLQILGTEPGAELIRHGARGFYRRLDRDEGAERIELRRDIALALVEDAMLEDPEEAAEMSRDLLCIWEPEDEGDFRAPPPLLD